MPPMRTDEQFDTTEAPAEATDVVVEKVVEIEQDDPPRRGLKVWIEPYRLTAFEDARIRVANHLNRTQDQVHVPMASSALTPGPCYSDFDCGNMVWRNEFGSPDLCPGCRARIEKARSKEKQSMLEALTEKLSPF